MGFFPMLSKFLNDLFDDTAGATSIEYGLILGLIALAIFGATQSFAGGVTGMFGYVSDEADEAMENTPDTGEN